MGASVHRRNLALSSCMNVVKQTIDAFDVLSTACKLLKLCLWQMLASGGTLFGFARPLQATLISHKSTV